MRTVFTKMIVSILNVKLRLIKNSFMTVGCITEKPGIYTEEGRFAGEMGCTEHNPHFGTP